MPRNFHREKRPRQQLPVILIACEGSETEIRYFESLVRTERIHAVEVVPWHPQATDPLNIVDAVIQKRKERRQEGRWTAATDQCWAVFDGVEHYRNARDNWHNALDKAKGNDIHLAISNPCFELWYLWHFQEQTGWIERDDALRLLREHLPHYNKADVLYPQLQSRTPTALKRAHVMAKTNADIGQPLREQLTAEGVARLVAHLLTLTK